MPKRLASWNPARDVWETDQGLFCGHLDVWSETWPNWVMWDESGVYELPTPEHRMVDSDSSSLPTPRATRGGSNTETVALLSTPQARDHKGRPADGFNSACLVRDIEDLMG